MRGYKRLIDEGYGATAAEARRHEVQVSTEHMKSVSAGDVASRRLGGRPRPRADPLADRVRVRPPETAHNPMRRDRSGGLSDN